VILKLKNEIDELKNQLSLATGNAYQTSELSQVEIEKYKYKKFLVLEFNFELF